MRGEQVQLARRRRGVVDAVRLLRAAVLAAWLGAASSSQAQGRASARPDADAAEAQRTVQALSDRFVRDDFAGVVALLDLAPFRQYVREVADRLRPLSRSARELTVADLKTARPGLTDDQARRELEMLRLTTPPDGMPSPTTREFGGVLGLDSLGRIPLDTLARRWLSAGAGGPMGFRPGVCPSGRLATRLPPPGLRGEDVPLARRRWGAARARGRTPTRWRRSARCRHSPIAS
jgi:hypothetical protein